jgi:hypothetical protein
MKQRYQSFSVLMAAVLLASCGSSDDSDSDDSDSGAEDVSYSSLQINAADYDAWVYVSLTTGATLDLTDEEAATSTDWQLAFRRTAIKLNGGVSGSGNVQVALADAQDEFYDDDGAADVSVFTNAVADTEAAALEVSYDTSALTFSTDANEAAWADWYEYDTSTHQIAANTTVGWLLRHADGETYSKVFLDVASYTDITARFTTQAADTAQFAGTEQSVSATFADDATMLCLDLDSASEVDCDENSADWDLLYEVDTSNRAINIWTNGGVYGDGDGAVFGSIDATELADYTSATLVDSYDISSHYSEDSSSNPFSDDSWYAYNLNGGHLLWPNFRTYLIDTDSTDDSASYFTLQVSDYYSLGASGSPEIRFQTMSTGE